MRTFLRRAAAFVAPAGPRAVSAGEILAGVESRTVVDQFHALWYASGGSREVSWRGHAVLKNPLDLWIYQQIIYDNAPDVIVETGTHEGGSALFFADVARMFGRAMDVITIDFNPKIRYDAGVQRIRSIRAVSTSRAALDEVGRFIEGRRAEKADLAVMVVLDSDHARDNVSRELEVYSPLVTPGQFLVVEDTNVNGHPVLPGHGPGPFEAVEAFLARHPEFRAEARCERFLITHNPQGWLRRQG